MKKHPTLEKVLADRPSDKFPDVKAGDICLVTPRQRPDKNEEQYLILVIFPEKRPDGKGGKSFYYTYVNDRKEIVEDYGKPHVNHSNMILGASVKVVDHEPLQEHKYKEFSWYLTGNDYIDFDKMPNLDGRSALFEKYAPKHIKEIYDRQENINFHQENAQMVNDFCEWCASGKQPKDFAYTEVGEDFGGANAAVEGTMKTPLLKKVLAQGYSYLSVELTPRAAIIKLDKDAFNKGGLNEGGQHWPTDDEKEKERILNDVENELHERWMVNNGMSWVAPEEIGALTDAPMFGDVDRGDNGDVEAVHDLYYYNDYMLKDWREELLDKGEVRFTKHQEGDKVEPQVAEGAGEADQDYDKELFDAIAEELKKHGYDVMHKEFDKYQGVYMVVKHTGKQLGKFWVKDFYHTGETKEPTGKYRDAYMVDEAGNEVSANSGDYFMMKDSDVFEGSTLFLVDMNGNKSEIENPKKSDLPDLTDVQKTIEYKGQPDSVVVFEEERNPELDFSVIVSGDYKTVEAGELLEYLDSKIPKAKLHANTLVLGEGEEETPVAEEKKAEADNSEGHPSAAPEEKRTQAATWKERLDEVKQIFPDTEKMLQKLGKIVEPDAIMQVNHTMSDSYNDDDKKIEGQDSELPYWLEENFATQIFWGNEGQKRGWIEGLAATSLRELAQIFPEVKQWCENPENAYISWGETSGMMPYHHANYPKDAVLLWIEGHDTDEEIQYEISFLADKLGKKKDIEKFKQWLQAVSDHSLGYIYRYKGDDSHVEAYERVQYNFAIYFKVSEVMKVINKAMKAHKEIVNDKIKDLVKQVKDGAGDYE